MDARYDQIPEVALEWHDVGRGAVLATVVQTWGSAPRQAGSQLAISGAGEIMGSVSGGCVEGAVVVEALDALADGQPRLLSFGVADETAFDVGLACGGTIEVLVEPVGEAIPCLPVAVLRDIVAARAERVPVACVTDLTTWARHIAMPQDPAFADRFRRDQSGRDEAGRLVTLHNPALRLVVVGGVHIAQALLPMARLAGYAPVLVDPREAFASDLRFPGETLIHDWPDEALTSIGLDARTAVVTLTHDSKLDDPAIITALQSDVFYLGCLGSSRTHAKRLDRLRAAGLNEAQLARIHAPVGLNIGARSPAEIALATLAQITGALRGPK
ncbi:XdhC family protein [Roseinatronobacter bogoriensis]|uniref:XdhC/CoxI family protein n=1 Tax=Roseinatronobacter bogoriensis subsp. barguzinensis TaxID=441209 RepID=A0A2K8KE59_9RHOB|nr:MULTISPECIES: XdhC family protein [Rhodobaca]ATX66223.1 XdhC/CoxI family protein [Rhodobaca barguzinensis]MBB4207339.1 xanthine dehydrogenase accessory factor [Rhodobaca bogoriensis DSM 18756]TDW40355.1 xanthine dehydrogenase accessory factor [Rhodobaca barguzinensis]TDY70493.1 xanthine dehydrogenase accessory factor [Rhodobaca bogoriensis DSM 18756]